MGYPDIFLPLFPFSIPITTYKITPSLFPSRHPSLMIPPQLVHLFLTVLWLLSTSPLRLHVFRHLPTTKISSSLRPPPLLSLNYPLLFLLINHFYHRFFTLFSPSTLLSPLQPPYRRPTRPPHLMHTQCTRDLSRPPPPSHTSQCSSVLSTTLASSPLQYSNCDLLITLRSLHEHLGQG